MTSHIEAHIERIQSTDTHDLRRAVLRDGVADASVRWEHDDDVTTVHLGAFLDDRLVAVSTWIDAPFDEHSKQSARQLRGMATTPAVAGRGVGAALLTAGCDEARRAGAAIAWAHARVTALGFYERCGFVASGPVFATPATGLPHRLIHRTL